MHPSRMTSMGWNHWYTFLEEQWDKISGKYEMLRTLLATELEDADWGDALERVDKQHRAEIEAAINKFIATGKWPQLSPMAGSLLHERMCCALGFVENCRKASKALKVKWPTPRMNKGEAMRWFLIDCWNLVNLHTMSCDMSNAPHPAWVDRDDITVEVDISVPPAPIKWLNN